LPQRARLLFALVVVTPLGLLTSHYEGPASAWVRDHGSGVLYVMFWIFLVLLARPALPAGPVALAVLAATCALEVLQLWHPPFLERLRATWLGGTLLGYSFKLADFPWYGLGSLLGYAFARWAERTSPQA